MRYRVYAQTNKVGSTCETEFDVEPYEIEGLDEQQVAAYIEQIAEECLWDASLIEWGWEPID